MTPTDMIEQAALDGVTITVMTTGGIKANGTQQAVDRWAPILRDSKAALLAELQLEQRRAGVLAMLQANPGIRYAIEINEPDTDPVTMSLAIRDVASCELKIPQARFEPFELLALIEKHTAVNPNNFNHNKR